MTVSMSPNILLATVAILLPLVGSPQVAADKPNIVVFMANDMGYSDTGFTGSTDINSIQGERRTLCAGEDSYL